jgi:hypothetical protein
MMMRRQTGTAYSSLAPHILNFTLFWVWPILYSSWLRLLFARRLP